MSDKLRWPTFWALVAVFVFIVCLFAIPAFGELLAGSFWFFVPFIAFFVLGVGLIVFSLRGGLGGWTKTFFILTGAAAVGAPVSVLLHNLIYGLFADFWGSGDEFLFFIIAFIVCPLAFLVGAVGTIVNGLKNRGAS